jgi:hypothetical protein
MCAECDKADDNYTRHPALEQASEVLDTGGLDALMAMLEKAASRDNPDDAARDEMNEQLARMLEYARERETHAAEMTPNPLDTQTGRRMFCQTFAAWLMFQQEPQAIAYACALLAVRLREVLTETGQVT